MPSGFLVLAIRALSAWEFRDVRFESVSDRTPRCKKEFYHGRGRSVVRGKDRGKLSAIDQRRNASGDHLFCAVRQAEIEAHKDNQIDNSKRYRLCVVTNTDFSKSTVTDNCCWTDAINCLEMSRGQRGLAMGFIRCIFCLFLA